MGRAAVSPPTVKFCGLDIDGLDIDGVYQISQESIGFNYIVTPNVQHLVALDSDEVARTYYENALARVCDSNLVQLLIKLRMKKTLPITPGSDLTLAMFEKYLKPQDSIMILGSSPDAVKGLSRSYHLENIYCYSPPMGFADNQVEVEKAISEVKAIAPRYLFIALGFPRQEMLASRLQATCDFDCTAFCVGASIDFMTGHQIRAPKVFQKLKLEWFFRAITNPRRLGVRYLLDFFGLIKLLIKYR